MVHVIFPPQFRAALGGQLAHAAEGTSLRDVLMNLCAQRAELRALLFSASHELSPFIGFAIAGRDTFYTAHTIDRVRLEPGDSVEVIVAMAGG